MSGASHRLDNLLLDAILVLIGYQESYIMYKSGLKSDNSSPKLMHSSQPALKIKDKRLLLVREILRASRLFSE